MLASEKSLSFSKTENERYFSLAGIYTVSRRANISVEILSDLIFINRNSSILGRNTTIDAFGGSLDDVADIADDMESNPYAFSDTSDTEWPQYGRWDKNHRWFWCAELVPYTANEIPHADMLCVHY